MVDLSQYKDAYMREARQYLDTLNAGLLKSENTPGDVRHLNNMLHACHTFKSMAGIAHCTSTSTLLHVIEDVLMAVKKNQLRLGACADLLFSSFDVLEMNLKRVCDDKEETPVVSIIKGLEAVLTSRPKQPLAETEETPQEIALDEKIQSVEVKVERLDKLLRLAEELLIARLSLEQVKERLQDPELSSGVDTLTRLVSELQFNVMQSRTVPLNFVFSRFPRLVRDLSKSEKKEVDFHLHGGEIELDRSLAEDLVEPLVHLVRNAIDHGIESSKERMDLGKPAVSQLRIFVKRERGFVIIEVEDDGRGIDWDQIKTQAQRRRFVSSHPSREELITAIFSGLSTRRQVTEISGRGFGLNIVRQKVESLGGSVKIESRITKGTKFILEIPLTLAVFKVLFIKVGGKIFALSLANVERLVFVDKSQIKGMLNYESIVFDEEDIPITRLSELFGYVPQELSLQPIVIVKKGQDRLGLAVDELGQTQEIVLKPLKFTKEGRYFTGCTLLGTGEVCLVLDVANLMLSKRRVPVHDLAIKGEENESDARIRKD